MKDAAFHLDQATKRGNKIRRTNVHFSGPNDEGDHQKPLSDDLQAIQQEDVCSEPPEPLSYSVFQSHFQGSSTSSTQKIFLPKHIWEKLSKDQQQMIIDHNRSLPKSGSSSILTPNKSPSLLPHKPTPQQTAKSQQVHTHQSDESTADSPRLRPLLLILCWQWSINPFTPLTMMPQTSPRFFQPKDPDRFRSVNIISFNMPTTPTISCRPWCQWRSCCSDMRVIYKTHRKINISGIDNHEVNGLDVVTAATLLNTSLGKVIASSMNMPTLGKDHPSIHQDNLNGSRPMLMKSLSKLVVPNLSPLWMDILSLSSSRMVWPMPPPLEDHRSRYGLISTCLLHLS